MASAATPPKRTRQGQWMGRRGALTFVARMAAITAVLVVLGCSFAAAAATAGETGRRTPTTSYWAIKGTSATKVDLCDFANERFCITRIFLNGYSPSLRVCL